MKQTVDPTNVKPCPHMENLVSAWIDGGLKGVAKLYTEFHMKTCPQCTASLPFLQVLKGRLAGLSREKEEAGGVEPEMSAERWSKVNAEWDKTDSEQSVP